jgi:hypothetical protein
METIMKGYRTFIVSALMAIFGVLAIVDWNLVIDNPQAGGVAVFSAVVMAVLRVFTTTPPGVSVETPGVSVETPKE